MTDTSAFKDLPELFEVELGEAVIARTEALSTFRELGPPDLCHVVKSSGRAGLPDLGSYHYISGVDASSSASLAAYINSLTYHIEENRAWFSNTVQWRIRNGCYCCFNAFSRVDVRVDVKIPGGVSAYVVDMRGERHEATPEIWQETYLSAILRSILYSEDSYELEAYRRLDPITTIEGELRFLQAAEALFFKGWQVGSDPEIQVATVVSNHLTAGLMKYFGDCGRYQPLANLFQKLVVVEPEVYGLLSQCYIGMNEEVQAVKIMHEAMKIVPRSYTLLHTQCDFLRSKGKLDWALKLAKQAVNCAPSEFVTWEKLTDVYIELGEYEQALLTLNSCPMFTYNGKDQHRQLPTARVHLPFDNPISKILNPRVRTAEDEADPTLLRLPAPGLRGTWARAYALLTKLASKVGWDELLKTRSNVFVMEEEYRMHKAADDIRAVQQPQQGEETSGQVVYYEDGTVRKRGDEDDASTKGMMSPRSTTDLQSPVSPGDEGEAESKTRKESVDGSTLVPPPVPTIRISTESDRDVEADDATSPNNHVNGSNGDENATEEVKGKEKEQEKEGVEQEVEGLEKPAQAAAPPEQADPSAPPSPHPNAGNNEKKGDETLSFSNKRLCERWLDNLFMVLYEDLRVWTIFRAEVAHFKTQHVAYKKTGMEWEILGQLGLRLHHKEDAKECFQRTLETTRYRTKGWNYLMEMYSEEGDIQRTCQTAVRCAVYAWADYTEMLYPSAVCRAFFRLGRIHGHSKVAFTMISMGLPEPVLKLLQLYMNYGQVFKVEGWDF